MTTAAGAADTRQAEHVIKIVIKPLHTAVSGRARYQISALYRQENFAKQLASQLSAIEGITAARVNSLTGTVMVNYRLGLGVQEVTALVQKAVQRAASSLNYVKNIAAQKGRTAASGYNVHEVGEKVLAFIEEQITAVTREAQQLLSQDQHAARTSHVSKRRPKHLLKQKAEQGQPQSLWHTQSAEQVVAAIGGGLKQGLSNDEAIIRLQRYGLNELPSIAKRSELAILIEQFASIPVGLLGASAVVSIATGGLMDAAVILAVVFINAGIGFVTERQAENTIASLTKITPRYARIIRDGEVQEIPHAKVVVGDLLLLNPGDFVAADARVIKSQRLTVDESALTGESVPVQKASDFVAQEDTPLGDRINMVHMGTMVTGGNALVVIVAIGLDTEIGKIQSLVGVARPPETPMQIQLEKIGTQLAIISSVVCASVFFIGLLRGQSFLQMLKSSISLAVAAVPEISRV